MAPSIILLTICVSVFLFLAVVFSIYLLKVGLLAKRTHQAKPFTTITHFTKAEGKQEMPLGQPMTGYKLAKAK